MLTCDTFFSSMHIIGADEAGRGPWAGPVVAAAVQFRGKMIRGLADSKKLSESQREKLYDRIRERTTWGIGVASNTLIDEIGIKKATNFAFAVAIYQCNPGSAETIKIDGKDAFILPFTYESIVKGDQKVREIMAASILAKVYRDRLLLKYDELYPAYSFRSHKGYGTTAHQRAIAECGVCAIHRLSYRPLQCFQ